MMGYISSTILSPLEQVILAKISTREMQREQYRAESFHRVEVLLKPGGFDAFTLPLCQIKSDTHPRLTEPVAKAVLLDLKEQSFSLQRFEKEEVSLPPGPPLTLAALILQAALKWQWSPAQTRAFVDELKLYSKPLVRSGIDANLIDETRLRILSDYGKEYLPAKARRLPTSINRNDIIAPADIDQTPKKTKRLLSSDQHELYSILWSRFLAWQTADAKLETVTIEVTAGDNKRYIFKREDTDILFRGFMQVHEREEDAALRQTSHQWPARLRKGEPVRFVKFSLVTEKSAPKAPFTIDEICNGKIADRQEAQIALAVLLSGDFLQINGDGLTATEMGRNVPLPPELMDASGDTKITADADESTPKTVGITKSETVEQTASRMTCPQCGQRMVVRQGRFGRFLACSGYPACRYTQSVALDIPCPNDGCHGHLVERRSKNSKIFYGCSEYPRCQHAQSQLT